MHTELGMMRKLNLLLALLFVVAAALPSAAQDDDPDRDPNDSQPDFYVATLNRLAPDATWTGAGIGRDQLTLNRWSLGLGGHCRTGLEDNVRLDRDRLAPSNAALVQRVVELCPEYGRRPATVAEARAILHLPPAA